MSRLIYNKQDLLGSHFLLSHSRMHVGYCSIAQLGPEDPAASYTRPREICD